MLSPGPCSLRWQLPRSATEQQEQARDEAARHDQISKILRDQQSNINEVLNASHSKLLSCFGRSAAGYRLLGEEDLPGTCEKNMNEDDPGNGNGNGLHGDLHADVIRASSICDSLAVPPAGPPPVLSPSPPTLNGGNGDIANNLRMAGLVERNADKCISYVDEPSLPAVCRRREASKEITADSTGKRKKENWRAAVAFSRESSLREDSSSTEPKSQQQVKPHLRVISSASLDSSRNVDGEEVSQRRRLMKLASSNNIGHVASDASVDKDVVPIRKAPDKRKSVKGVFADPDDLKQKVRTTIEDEYDVKNFYKTAGVFQKIARHPYFDTCTLTIICFNAMWMWVDTDLNKETLLRNSHMVFQVAEHGLCAYFFIEIIIKFLAFEQKSNCLRDSWFVFDTCLVVMMVVETWIITIVIEFAGVREDGSLKSFSILKVIRIIKILRMARLVRLIRRIPEMMILINGMAMAARSVLLTICLLGIVIYIFAIAMTTMTRDVKAHDAYWSSVAVSMKTLLLHGCFLEGLPEVVNDTGEEQIAYGAVMLIFVMITNMTIMNMLAGVLVEVVNSLAQIERETIKVDYVRSKVKEALHCIGYSNDELITKSSFVELLSVPKATRALKEVGIDVVGLVDFSDFIFFENEGLTFSHFMELVLQLRGTNMATVKDVVDLRKCLQVEFDSFEELVSGSHNRENSQTTEEDEEDITPKRGISGISERTTSARSNEPEHRRNRKTGGLVASQRAQFKEGDSKHNLEKVMAQSRAKSQFLK